MALDMIVVSCRDEYVFHIKDALHSAIFESGDYTWRRTNFLKKTRDYYSDYFFYSDEAIMFIRELYDACVEIGVDIDKELKGIEVILGKSDIKKVKLLAD